MDVRDYKQEDRNAVDAFLERSRNSTLYHCIGWKMVVEDTFAHPFDYLIADDGKGIRGVLPLVHIRSFIFGNYMVSLPYFNYGGPCADSIAAESALIGEATRRAAMRSARFIEFRSVELWRNGFPVKTGKVSMVLDLPSSPKDLWEGFPSKLRSQIRRPEREGIRSRIGREEELDGFYKVFSINMRDLGTPVYPKRFFENVLHNFPSSSWICSIYRNREVVASGLLVGYRNRIEIPWASSLRRFNRFSPNMLLYWDSLRFSCESGYDSFDFGRSTPGEGTYRFKEQWGARPVQLYWHYWLQDKEPMPELNPGNPKYRFAISVWKKMPLSIANLIGPRIAKNLP